MPPLDRRSLLLGGLALAVAPAVMADDAPPFRILDEDPRLGKAVTIHLKRAPVAAVLSALDEQTRVRLGASADTAGEPALVYVNGQPARDVMRQLALLFNYRWRRIGKAGRYRYELYQDTASKREEEALRAEGQRRILSALQNEVRLCQDLLKDPHDAIAQQLEALSPRSPETISAVFSSDTRAVRNLRLQGANRRTARGRLQAMSDPHQRVLVQLAAALAPAQWAAMFDSERVLFSTREEPGAFEMPPFVRQALQAGRPAAILPGDRFVSPEVEQGIRQQARQANDSWSRAEGYRVSCEVTRRSRKSGSPGYLSIVPGAILAGDEQTSWARPLSLVVDWDQTDEPPDPEIVPEDAERDPVLAARRAWTLDVKPRGSPEWWSVWLTQVLPSLAESFELNLIADAYRSQRCAPPGAISSDELPLHTVLSRYLLPAAHCIRDGAFLRLRRQQWYEVRLTEIPEGVAKEWAAFLRAQPRLSLDELAGLTLAFRDEQLDETFEYVMREQRIELPELLEEIDGTRSGGGRAILRAYGSLPLPLRQRLTAGQPVPHAALPPEARAWLGAALKGRSRYTILPSAEQLAAGELRLALFDLRREVTQSGDQFVIEYHLTGDGARPERNGSPLFPSGFVERNTTPVAPEPGGQATQAVQFRYTYGGDKSLDWLLILPWIRVLPPLARTDSLAHPESR